MPVDKSLIYVYYRIPCVHDNIKYVNKSYACKVGKLCVMAPVNHHENRKTSVRLINDNLPFICYRSAN